MNVIGALQTGVIGLNRTLDNSLKSSSDQIGNGKPEVPELASGRSLNNAVNETTLEATTQAPTTKVVTDASEVLGTNIDTRA
ncbi:hypothetical protein [Neptunomonas sp.]|uniref:hypothetical protein n=1 Tax=Neptunomonas sp. TaxID=1971898 RepID=UPI0025E4D5EA|nr:hypothetical protein [Neptunomonas sp.]